MKQLSMFLCKGIDTIKDEHQLLLNQISLQKIYPYAQIFLIV